MRTLRQATPSGVISVVRLLARLGFRQSRIAIGATLAFLVAGPAFSQQQAVVAPGQAVVTGFSGFVAYPPPANADPFDYVTLNTLGPSARVVDLTNPGPQGVLSPAPKPLTINAAQVGQVFGVALDNAPQPNIYLGATSLYGLSIFRPDPQGLLKRQRQGAPGAQFVPGQFGPPELGGSSGSIWRVSGTTGEVSLFSAVGIGSPASLGGLAFHAGTQQIFATDRATGIVYRLSLDGLIKGTYDHGIEGRPGAGLAPLPLGPVAPVNINGPQFSTDNPATWGFAPPARRVFALAVHNDRLYYSIAQGPQIWSAGIRPTGSIPGSDARLEVEVPSLADGVEITSIAFDAQGRMYLAERGRTTGDYYMYHVASAGQSRVLRYVPKAPGDPAPGRWRLQPDQYSVGLAPFYNNADGGVALNYGYTPAGALNPGACGANVWMTGERLMDPGNAQAGTFETVDGLQGNAASVFQPQNMPPSAAWFVDYNDQPGNENYRGHMGDIATIPCPVAVPSRRLRCRPARRRSAARPERISSTASASSTRRALRVRRSSTGSASIRSARRASCMHGNQCVPPPQVCPPGHVFYQGKCVPLACPPGLIRLPNGFCAARPTRSTSTASASRRTSARPAPSIWAASASARAACSCRATSASRSHARLVRFSTSSRASAFRSRAHQARSSSRASASRSPVRQTRTCSTISAFRSAAPTRFTPCRTVCVRRCCVASRRCRSTANACSRAWRDSSTRCRTASASQWSSSRRFRSCALRRRRWSTASVSTRARRTRRGSRTAPASRT
jgi:hypothetical protein